MTLQINIKKQNKNKTKQGEKKFKNACPVYHTCKNKCGWTNE